MEHGSETDKVPAKWRKSPRFKVWSLYGLSSFNYTLTGLLLCALMYARPERSLYAAEKIEAALWILQGLISFKCDVLDIGIRSWSHPVDRISATIFTLQQVLKYLVVRCAGAWGTPMYAGLFALVAVGVLCFRQSCLACRHKQLEAFRFWHITWHIVFPAPMAGFYLAAYLAPAEKIHCWLAWPFG